MNHARRLTVHYVFEPDSFVPLLQASSQSDIRKMFLQRPEAVTTEYIDEDGNYDIDQDPLYNGDFAPGDIGSGHGVAPLEHLHYYQCDHLGTPMELTDQDGNIAWEASYQAWGEAKITISEAARKAQLKNPIRFQGQYFDEESGLHYNRHRYYDPVMGRFISKDPISLRGGTNLHQYAPNPINWIDPFGLVNLRSIDPARASLTGVQTRCWYLREESRIDEKICKCNSSKERARLAHKLRNEARIRARLLSNDPKWGVGLYKGGEESGTGSTEPMLKWKDVVARAKAKGAVGNDVYSSIEISSQKSRSSVNKALDGINCEQELKGL